MRAKYQFAKLTIQNNIQRSPVKKEKINTAPTQCRIAAKKGQDYCILLSNQKKKEKRK
jgi:hypothetical protein